MTARTAETPWAHWDKEYREFQRREGIPVHTGFAVGDIRELSVDQWDRIGGRGAFINLHGMEGTCDLQIIEIPPGSKLRAQRHLHDSLVFVVDGSGFTTIGTKTNRTSFEWDERAAFLIPRNTQYVHTNATDEPIRLLVQTPLPLLYSLLKEDEAIWNDGTYNQWAQSQRENFYSSDSTLRSGSGNDSRTYWTSNFIPDTLSFDKLTGWAERGGGGRSVFFPFRPSAMWAHISEFAVGQYKKAHRHMCGANVLLLSGEGYSLLWQEGDEERMHVDWSPYSLFVPPSLWYHQQFNTSTDPARYLVFHSPITATGMQGGKNDALQPLSSQNQIEYHEEDAEIREQFICELDENGIEFQMNQSVFHA